MKKISRILAVFFILATVISLAVPVMAVEPRYTTNGYTSNTYYYGGKPYTISLGVGGLGDYQVFVAATCDAADIDIVFSGVTARFDTINYGYVTDTGASCTKHTVEGTSVYISEKVSCPRGTAQVLRVLHASCSATFLGLDAGQNTNMTVTYSAQ